MSKRRVRSMSREWRRTTSSYVRPVDRYLADENEQLHLRQLVSRARREATKR